MKEFVKYSLFFVSQASNKCTFSVKVFNLEPIARCDGPIEGSFTYQRTVDGVGGAIHCKYDI